MPLHDVAEPGAAPNDGLQTVTGRSPIEAKMAALDEGSARVPVRLVSRYTAVLDRLGAKCTQSREQIGDIAAVGVRDLKARKRFVHSHIEMLDAMDTALAPEASASLGRTDCTSVMAALVVTMTPAEAPR